MTPNRTFWKAFHSLVHPLSLLAIILLLVNDHWLRYAHSSWLTGKLGDFTWLVFAPFIAALLFSWLIPRKWKRHSELVGGLSIGFIGVWFATAKTIPLAYEWTTQTLYAIVGWEGQLRLDVTDLLTLPALLISWHIWQKASDNPVSLKPLAYVAFGLAMLGTLASDSPQYSDYGIRDICNTGDALILDTTNMWGERYIYQSQNGGLNWHTLTSYDENVCLQDSQNEATDVTFRWIQADKIEISHDGGNTWLLDYDLEELRQEIRYVHRHLYTYSNRNMFDDPGPYSVTYDQNSENYVFTMGWDGILVRQLGGTYTWVNVREYYLPDTIGLSDITDVILFEICLAITTIFLIVTTSVGFIRRQQQSRINKLLKASWILYVAILGLVILERHDASAHAYGSLGLAVPVVASMVSLPAMFVLAIPLSIGAVWDILRNFRSIAISIALAGISNGALFIFPFILWTQGRIPRYVTAFAFSIFLTLMGLYATRIYLKRILPVLEPEKGKRDAVEKAKSE